MEKLIEIGQLKKNNGHVKSFHSTAQLFHVLQK